MDPGGGPCISSGFIFFLGNINSGWMPCGTRTCHNGDHSPTFSCLKRCNLSLSFQTHESVYLCCTTVMPVSSQLKSRWGMMDLLHCLFNNIQEPRNCLWSETLRSRERESLRSAYSELRVSFQEVPHPLLPGLFNVFWERICYPFLTASWWAMQRSSFCVRPKNHSSIIRQYSARSVSTAGVRTGFLPILVWTTSTGNLSTFLI
jgi:hypothetical protein